MSRDALSALTVAVLAAAAAAGCSGAPDRAPRIDHLTPSGGVADLATAVVVHGRGFYPRTVQSASGGPAAIDVGQKAWLDGVALEGVVWVDEETLQLTIPAGLALGPHELAVENALGLRTTLGGAWTVIQPATLDASARLTAAVASTGQALALTVTLRNDGGAAVQGVAISLASSGAGAVVVGALPAAVDVPAGGSVDVQVPLTAQAAGAVSLRISAAGLEAYTGRSLQANAAAAVLTVQARAALAATLSLPVAVDVAAPFTVTMVVRNDGDVTALGVSPGALSLGAGAGGPLPTLTGPTPALKDIPGHGSATFTWTARLTSGATVVLTGGAAGTDANDGAPVTAAAATSNAGVPQASAALSMTAVLGRSVASTTQQVGLQVVVRNDGGATAQGVALAVAASGSGGVTVGPLPSAFDLAPGASATFTIALTAVSAGSVAVNASASGAEITTGLPVSAAAGAGTLTVQARAALTATLSLPVTVSVAASFTVTMKVSNSGDVAALGVSPGALALGAGAGGPLPTLTGPTPARADIPGHGSATFTWTARLTSGATVLLTGGAAGTDANDGAPVTAAPATSNAGVPQASAALSMTAVLARSVASTTQQVGLQVVVRNTGGATARNVTLAVAVAGTGAATVGTLPSAFDLAAGASSSQVISLTATSAGSVAVSASASGTEITTGLPLSAAAGAGTLVVQARAALTATLSLPATVTVATPFTVTMTVANGGDATALGVSPGALALAAGAGGLLPTLTGPTPARADVPGHRSATFTWTARLASGETVVLTGGAAGTDANDGAPVTAATVTSNPAVPQVSAALSLTATLLRSVASSTQVSVASTSQVLGLRLVVTNTGGATARNVTLVVAAAGTGAATVGTLPSAFDLAAGASSTQVIALTATSVGTVTVSASAGGAEITTGFPLSAAASAGTLTVQLRSALSATLAIPTTIALGSNFTATMTVSNSGDADALGVQPTTLLQTVPLVFLLVAGPVPASVTVPAHGSATFTWTMKLQLSGPARLTCGAAGTDANDLLPVAAPTVQSNGGGAPPETTLVASNPFGDGSATGQLAVHDGRLWLGPSANGKTLWQLDPATGQTAITGVQISVDTGSSAANNAYWKPRQTADTLGVAGCAKDSAACGPDNENARGLFTGGAGLGADWLLYGGTGLEKVQDLYLGSGATSAFSTVDLGKVLPDGAVGFTAAAFAAGSGGGRLYLAATDKAANKSPYLVALTTAPSSAWLDAVAGTDAVELGAATMPGIGGNASVFKNGDAQPRIDAIAAFRGLLYLGSGGGLMRSTVAQPRSYASQPGDWTYAGLGPLLPLTWLAKSSVEATDPTALTPADRAVPAMAAFGTCGTGACLFVARNVKSGSTPAVVPQLWVCDPTTSAPVDACDFGDWSLAAPNTSGDAVLTQLNVATRGALSVLLATSKYLYVGFDDAGGAQLYRTSKVPAAPSDFTGTGGCAAGTAACPGLGGAGLGDATMTRFLDAKAVTVNGQTTVYLLAAGTTGAQKLFAVEE